MAVAIRKPHYFQATHFLSFPIYNSRSKLQLESFAHRLRNDEYAEGIPRKCFILPPAFHINVADLRLETCSDVKAALNLLRRLDMQRMLKDAATSSTTAGTKDSGGAEGEKIRTRISVGPLVPPLHISLTGLRGSDRLNRQNLFGRTTDPSDRLRGLVRSVRREFASAGFYFFSGLQNNEEEYVDSKALAVALLNNKGDQRIRTFVDFSGTVVKKQRKADYDATPLLQRYENVEIARDIVIEKLSLCKEGRKRTFRGENNEFVVDEYFEEIDSIPMPQEAGP